MLARRLAGEQIPGDGGDGLALIHGLVLSYLVSLPLVSVTCFLHRSVAMWHRGPQRGDQS